MKTIKCPFCGQESLQISFTTFAAFLIRCSQCGSRGPACGSEAHAKNTWKEVTGQKEVFSLRCPQIFQKAKSHIFVHRIQGIDVTPVTVFLGDIERAQELFKAARACFNDRQSLLATSPSFSEQNMKNVSSGSVWFINMFEAGLMYSDAKEGIKQVLKEAKERNFQVFLYTQSLDCLEALCKHGEPDQVSVHRLETTEERVFSYTIEEVSIALEQGMEIR